MNSNFNKIIAKAQSLDVINNSVVNCFTYLSNNSDTYSLGVHKNCTVYKNGVSVCYVYFLTKSIQVWDEDQSGNECMLYNQLIAKGNFQSRVKLVPKKSDGIPIQKLSLTDDTQVVAFMTALQNV